MADYTPVEKYDMFGGKEAELNTDIETGNWLVGTKEHCNISSYITNQFDWGRYSSTFYRHPTEDYRSHKATDIIMGK